MTRKELNRLRTIDDIEAGFLRIYSERGIDEVRVADICEMSGVSRSTFYLYFDDKYAVLERVEERLLGKMWEYCGILPELVAKGIAPDAARRTIRYIRENIGWYRALLGIRGDPRFVHRWIQDIDRSLQMVLVQRNVQKDDSAIQCRIFAYSLIGLYTYMVFENPVISEEKLVNYMSAMLERILSHRV